MSNRAGRTSGDPETWSSRLVSGGLLGLFLAWLVLGTYDATTLRTPEGKLGERQRLTSFPTLLTLAACEVAGLLVNGLPGLPRYVARGITLGAFVGYLAAVAAARLELGFGEDVGWRELLPVIHDGLMLTVPAGAIIGIGAAVVLWCRHEKPGLPS